MARVLRLRKGFRLYWHVIAFSLLLPVAMPVSAASANKPINIFVSILPQKYFVESIGGQYVDVHVMVGPGQSPHTYELTPKQMVKLSEARIFFRIGIEFENAWLERVKTANPELTIIDARQAIELRDTEHGDLATGGGEHEHGLKDPHVWTDPRNVQKIMQRFTQDLSALYPQLSNEFHANFGRFAASLDELDRTIRSLFQGIHKKPFLVFHPSWGYFAQRYALTQIPIEWEGKTPSARELAAVIDYAKRHDLRHVFVQKQFGSQEAQAVADAIGGEIVVVDPLAENYEENLLHVARLIAGSMR